MAGCFFGKTATKRGILSASTSRENEIGIKKKKLLLK